MEPINNNNNNEARSWGYGPIDVKTFNSDAATFGGPPQAANDDICGPFFPGVLSEAFQPGRAFQPGGALQPDRAFQPGGAFQPGRAFQSGGAFQPGGGMFLY